MRTKNRQKISSSTPPVTKPLAVRLAEIWVLVCLYGALLTPLVVVRETIFPFVYPKVLFFQAVVDLSFPVWVALPLRDRLYRPRRSWLLWGALAWVLAMGLATCFAENPSFSLFSYPERMTGLWTQVHQLGWLVMAVGMVKTAERRNRLVTVHLAVAFLVACTAIAQQLDPTFTTLGKASAGARLSGTLGNPIYLGGYETFSI